MNHLPLLIIYSRCFWTAPDEIILFCRKFRFLLIYSQNYSIVFPVDWYAQLDYEIYGWILIANSPVNVLSQFKFFHRRQMICLILSIQTICENIWMNSCCFFFFCVQTMRFLELFLFLLLNVSCVSLFNCRSAIWRTNRINLSLSWWRFACVWCRLAY